MLCFGLLIYFCDVPSPTAINDYCEVMRPYVTQQKYKPSRTDSEQSKRRYLAIVTDYKRICTAKVKQHAR